MPKEDKYVSKYFKVFNQRSAFHTASKGTCGCTIYASLKSFTIEVY